MDTRPKHTPEPWEWELVPGAGLHIKGKLYTLPATACPDNVGKVFTFFRLPQLRDLTVRFGDDGVMYGTLSYEDWVQFPTPEWKEMQTANARRIVACVNACAGIPTKELENGEVKIIDPTNYR